jgi:hypothetical protein
MYFCLCFCLCQGENIFALVNSAIEGNHVPWINCLTLGSDNANAMVGTTKGLYGLVLEKNDQVFLSGCTLHIVHNRAKKAASELPSFDELLMDIDHYFQKSSTRQHRFQNEQEFCGVEQRKILKHVCTRWLSITRYGCSTFFLVLCVLVFLL